MQAQSHHPAAPAKHTCAQNEARRRGLITLAGLRGTGRRPPHRLQVISDTTSQPIEPTKIQLNAVAVGQINMAGCLKSSQQSFDRKSPDCKSSASDCLTLTLPCFRGAFIALPLTTICCLSPRYCVHAVFRRGNPPASTCYFFYTVQAWRTESRAKRAAQKKPQFGHNWLFC